MAIFITDLFVLNMQTSLYCRLLTKVTCKISKSTSKLSYNNFCKVTKLNVTVAFIYYEGVSGGLQGGMLYIFLRPLETVTKYYQATYY